MTREKAKRLIGEEMNNQSNRLPKWALAELEKLGAIIDSPEAPEELIRDSVNLIGAIIRARDEVTQLPLSAVVKDYASWEEKKIRPITQVGRGRYLRYVDHTADYCAKLDAYGVAYELGNDAPRGGRLGAYILIR